MKRLSLIAAGLMLAALNLFAASPAFAQPLGGLCAIERMPPLPAGANTVPTERRQGFVFVAGAYRCANRRWEYVPGHWERARRNAVPNPLTMIEVRQGRVHARPGYEIVQQGTGASTQTVLRQAGRGPNLGFSAVEVTVYCTCGLANSCPVVSSNNTVRCDNNRCSQGCALVTRTGGTNALSSRTQILGTTPCGRPGVGLTAAR